MNRAHQLRRGALALILTLGVAACGANPATPAPAPSPAARTTITPAASEPTRQPTSTLAPTVEAIGSRPEVAEAMALIEQGQYEAAVSRLRPIYLEAQDAGDPRQAADLRELQEQLARAYLDWGRALLAASGGDLRQISIAYDRFNDGVTLAGSENGSRADLVAERDTAASLIRAAQGYEQLSGVQTADARALAEEIVAALAVVGAYRADYPGLMPLRYDALVAAAAIYEESPSEGKDARLTALKQALTHCEAATTLDRARKEAPACVQRVNVLINQITAPPTRTPAVATPTPSRLRFRVLNYNDDPSCISMQVARINTGGWFFTVDGMRLRGNFDNAGNVRLCGLGAGQEVTFTVFDGSGRAVPGGSGVPSKGSAIMGAEWR